MSTSATPPSPAPTRQRRWPWLLGALLGVLVLLVVLLGVAGSRALHSERGSAWLLRQVPGLRVSGQQGALGGGPFAAARIEYGAAGGLHIVADGVSWRDLQWRWRPYAGAWVRVQIDGLRVQRAQVHTAPGNGARAQTPQAMSLPLELVLPDAQVQTLAVNGVAPLQALHASLHLGDDRGRRHRVQQLAFAWDRLQVNASGELGAQAPMTVAAQAQVQSDAQAGATGPLGTAWSAHVNAGGTLQRLVLDAQLHAAPRPPDAPNAAALAAHGVLTPFAAWPLAELNARLVDLNLATLASGAPATRLNGQAVLHSTGADQPAQVDLQLSNALPGRWDEGQLPLRQLTLALRGRPDDPRKLELPAFDLQFGTARAAAGRLSGSGRWQGDTLSLQTQVDALQPAALDQRLAAMQLAGPLKLTWRQATAPGWQAALDARLEGRLQDLANAPPVHLQLQAAVDSGAQGLHLALNQLEARAGAARASAKADAVHRTEGGWQLSSEGALAQFDPLPWWPGAAGSAWRAGGHRLNARWQLAFTLPAGANPAAPLLDRLPALRGDGALELADSRLANVPVSGQASVHAGGSGPIAWKVQLQAASNRLQGDGQRALQGQGGNDRWQLKLQATALPQLAPLLRLAPALAAWAPSSGSAEIQAQGQGRWPALRTHGQLRVAALQTPALSLAQAQAQWQLGDDGLDAPLQLHLQADQLVQGPARIEHLLADLGGTPRQHHLLLQADTAGRPPAWAEAVANTPAGTGTQLRLALDGRWQPQRDGGRWQAQVQQLRATPTGRGAGRPWVAADNLQLDVGFGPGLALLDAQVAPNQLQALGAVLRWQVLRWQAARPGTAPHIEAQAQLEPLALAPLLARLQPDFGWGGDLRIGGQVNVSSANGFDADVVLERSSGDLSVTDEGGTQTLGLTDLRVGLAAHGGVWHFTEAAAGRTVGVLAGAQSFRLPADAVWPRPDTPMEGVVELRVDNLGVWGPWTPPGWRLTGQLHTTATLGGRFAAPEYTGRLEAHDLGARNLLQGVNLTQGEVQVALNGPVAQIERFTFKGGEGSAQVTGGASFGAAPRAQLALQATHFQLLGRVDRRIVVSGRAQMDFQPDVVHANGRFVVDQGLIDFSRANAPTLDDDVVVVRKTGTPAAADSQQANAAPKAPRKLDADLRVDLGNDLRIRGHGIDTALAGELHITTPNSRLAVDGTVSAVGGTYNAYGQKLDIERGRITFIGPVENPRLDILALRPNLDVRVGVSVGGTALQPRVRLYAEPEMSDTDKLSWLVLGRAPEGLGRNDTALLQRAAMMLLAGGEGGESATDKIMRSLGLDAFSLRQENEGDVRSTVVALGKQISQRVYVGYERGLNSTTGSWQLIYRIAQRLTVRAQTGSDNALDLIRTWRWN